MERVLRILGRLCLAAIFVNSGVDLIQNPEGRSKRAAESIPAVPETPVLGQVHGGTMAVAGTTLGLGILPALSAAVLAGTLVLNTYVGHPFWNEEDPQARRGQIVHFLKNLGLMGGLLTVIAEDRLRKRG